LEKSGRNTVAARNIKLQKNTRSTNAPPTRRYSGRAIAVTWRPIWQVAIYTLVLGAVVRFFHMALFGGTLLSAHYYAVDALVCLAFGFAGFQAARMAQMTRQYGWLMERHGPVRWRRKTP